MKQLYFALIVAALGLSACSPDQLSAPAADVIIEAAPEPVAAKTSAGLDDSCASSDGIGGTGCAIE